MEVSNLKPGPFFVYIVNVSSHSCFLGWKLWSSVQKKNVCGFLIMSHGHAVKQRNFQQCGYMWRMTWYQVVDPPDPIAKTITHDIHVIGHIWYFTVANVANQTAPTKNCWVKPNMRQFTEKSGHQTLTTLFSRDGHAESQLLFQQLSVEPVLPSTFAALPVFHGPLDCWDIATSWKLGASPCQSMCLPSLELTYLMKIHGWFRWISFWRPAYFQGRTVSFRECNL